MVVEGIKVTFAEDVMQIPHHENGKFIGTQKAHCIGKFKFMGQDFRIHYVPGKTGGGVRISEYKTGRTCVGLRWFAQPSKAIQAFLQRLAEYKISSQSLAYYVNKYPHYNGTVTTTNMPLCTGAFFM